MRMSKPHVIGMRPLPRLRCVEQTVPRATTQEEHMSAPGDYTIVLFCTGLLATLAGCSRATAAGDRETFRGVYEVGRDRSAFLPCGSDEQWYVQPNTSQARELLRLTNVQDLQPPAGGMSSRSSTIRRAYVEVRGDTVPSASRNTPFYERELQLAEVLVVKAAQGSLCPPREPAP